MAAATPAIARAIAPDGAMRSKPLGNSSAMKAVESLPARQRGCCHHRREERDVVANAVDGEGVERIGLRLDRLRRGRAHG